MHPQLVDNTIMGQHVQLYAYPLLLTTAAVVVLWLSWWMATRAGFPNRKILICLGAAVVTTLLGARLLHAGLNWNSYKENPSQFFSSHLENFALYGGVLMAAITGIFTTRALGLDSWRLVDRITPCLAIGIAIARIGCYLEGCCFGETTGLPWGVVFPIGSPAQLHQSAGGLIDPSQVAIAVHPTQLYELVAALLVAALSLYILQKRVPSGSVFLIATVAFSAFRILNSHLRVPSDTLIVPWWWPTAFYGSIIIVSLSLLFWRIRFASGTIPRPIPTGSTSSIGNQSY
ncbi:MAG: prolipoprotein diacylglyceryl transferase [Thermoleophilia bacterium]